MKAITFKQLWASYLLKWKGKENWLFDDQNLQRKSMPILQRERKLSPIKDDSIVNRQALRIYCVPVTKLEDRNVAGELKKAQYLPLRTTILLHVKLLCLFPRPSLSPWICSTSHAFPHISISQPALAFASPFTHQGKVEAHTQPRPQPVWYITK